MSRLRAAFILALLAALTFEAAAHAAPAKELAEVRRIEQTFLPVDTHAVRLDASFGSVVVRGEPRADIAVEIVLSCPAGRDQQVCRQRAARLLLEARNRPKHLALRLKRTPRARIHGIRSIMTVTMPENEAVEIDVRSGNVEISGMQSHLEVDVGTGDTTIFYPQSRVQIVKLDVAFGHANLWLTDGSNIRGTGWPKSLTWRSQGVSHVEVDAGKGVIAVRLMD